MFTRHCAMIRAHEALDARKVKRSSADTRSMALTPVTLRSDAALPELATMPAATTTPVTLEPPPFVASTVTVPKTDPAIPKAGMTRPGLLGLFGFIALNGA